MIMSTTKNEKRLATKKHSGYVRTVPLDIRRRIGSTIYNVTVFTKEDTGDTVEEKVLRLVRNDLNIANENVKIKYRRQDGCLRGVHNEQSGDR